MRLYPTAWEPRGVLVGLSVFAGSAVLGAAPLGSAHVGAPARNPVVMLPRGHEEARPAPLDSRLKAVVRVDASGCENDEEAGRRGSGFVWHSAGTVVTALHVIAGCSKLSVWYPTNGGVERSAHPGKVSMSVDLAELIVDDPVAVAPLAVAAAEPPGGAEVTAWGYPIVMNGLIDATFHRRQSGGTLDEVLTNDSTRAHVREAGMPSLKTDVMWLDQNSNLFAGYSGGPLLDDAGQVVAIADGGLEEGATGVNWAIFASSITTLMASTDRPPSRATIAGAAHRYGLEAVDSQALKKLTFDVGVQTPTRQAAPDLTSISCGGGIFVKARTRSFAQIAPSADDQRGLQYLLSAFGRFVTAADSFDVYQELTTGAVAVVPAGSGVRSSAKGPWCVAEASQPATIQQVFEVAKGNAFATRAAMQSYENGVGVVLGSGWVTNPSFSYQTPFVRPYDGLTVERASMIQNINGSLARWTFQTLAFRSNSFLGMTVIRHDYNPLKLQAEQFCVGGGQAPQCPEVLDHIRSITRAIIATHLSTFPIN